MCVLAWQDEMMGFLHVVTTVDPSGVKRVLDSEAWRNDGDKGINGTAVADLQAHTDLLVALRAA